MIYIGCLVVSDTVTGAGSADGQGVVLNNGDSNKLMLPYDVNFNIF
jgi:hypothetical protein